jgi:hypothetical protein
MGRENNPLGLKPTGLNAKGEPRQRMPKQYKTMPKKGGSKKDIKKVITKTIKKHAGVPKLYDKNYHPHMAYMYCSQLGCTYEQIATFFSINQETLWSWRHEFPELAKAIERGTDEYSVEHVESALHKRAVGYKYTEKEWENVPIYRHDPIVDEDGNTVLDKNGKPKTEKVLDHYELQLKKKVEKELPPDVGAIEYTLNNRAAKRWKNSTNLQIRGLIGHVGLGGDVGGLTPIDVTLLDDAMLDKLLAIVGGDEPPNLINNEDKPEIEEIEYKEVV